ARNSPGTEIVHEHQPSPRLAGEPECQEMSELMERQRNKDKKCSHPSEPQTKSGKCDEPGYPGDARRDDRLGMRGRDAGLGKSLDAIEAGIEVGSRKQAADEDPRSPAIGEDKPGTVFFRDEIGGDVQQFVGVRLPLQSGTIENEPQRSLAFADPKLGMKHALAAAARHDGVTNAIGLTRRAEHRDAHFGAMPVLPDSVPEAH